MPIYAYRCQNCGSEFEKVQKYTDKPATKCAVCGKGPVRRIMQPSAIVFKGSGWYATDHRSPSGNGGNGKGEKSDKSEKGEAAEKTGSSEKAEPAASKSDGDSKPAKKETKAPKSDEK